MGTTGMRVRAMASGGGLALALYVLTLAVPNVAASDGMKGALLYANCAGIADAMFTKAMASDDRPEMDYYADEAHIFMSLARRERGAPAAGVLQQLRVEASAHLFHEGATADDIHVMVQECSDVRQQLAHKGRFRE